MTDIGLTIFDPLDPGSFPVDALESLEAIAKEFAAYYDLPVSMTGMTAIATLSGAAGKAYIIRNGIKNGLESHANLQIFIAAERGTGKGLASKLAEPLIAQSQVMAEEFNSKILPAIKSEASVLENEIRNMSKNVPRDGHERDIQLIELTKKQARMEELKPGGQFPPAPSLWSANSTSESLAWDLKASNDTTFVFTAEGGEVVRVLFGKYTNGQQGDYDLWLSGYSSEHVKYSRRSSGQIELKPTLSALVFIQPFILREVMNKQEASERGLTARLLVFDANATQKPDDGIERKINQKINEGWKRLVERVINYRLEGKSIVYECSDEAKEGFRQFHNWSLETIKPFLPKESYGEISRWRENAIRLALVLKIASDTVGQLESQTAKNAVAIVKWCGLSYLQLIRERIGEQRMESAKKLQDLVDAYNGQVTLRDLDRRHGFKRETVLGLVEEFPTMLEIKSIKSDGAGRPSIVLKIPDPSY